MMSKARAIAASSCQLEVGDRVSSYRDSTLCYKFIDGLINCEVDTFNAFQFFYSACCK